MILAEAQQEVQRLSRDMHVALDWLRDNAQESAAKEREYRKARSLAWVNRTEGTAGERQAHVDADTADMRYERDLAEKLEKAAVEKIRGIRQEISLWQSLLAAHRAEAELAGKGPDA